MKTLVIIPCYRCAPQIVRVLKEFSECTKLYEKIDKILVVDNRSPDDTIKAAVDVVSSLNLNKVTVVENNENYGLGGTHKAAILYAKEEGYDLLGVVHGDNQAVVAELLEFIEQAERDSKNEIAAFLGSRFSFGSKRQGYSKMRIFGNLVLNTLYTILSGRLTVDLGSGLNLFRLKEIDVSKIINFSDAFTFNMNLLLYYFQLGKLITYIPITWKEFDQVSNARNFKVAFEAIKILIRWRFGKEEVPSRRFKNYSFNANLKKINLQTK